MYIKSHQKQHGVSLIEVLIALLVVAVGVLGLAKMQALAVANSQSSGVRGLVALQASSLASTMHSNKVFWQVPSGTAVPCAGATCNLSGATLTTGHGFAAPPSSCLNTNLCTQQQLAAWDVNNWMAQINANVPTYNAIINCVPASTVLPVTCTIEITWNEKQAITTANVPGAASYITQAFYLYVQP